MSTETIEQRLHKFVAETDEPAWDDVLARAGKRRARLPRGRLVLALAACLVAAAFAAFLAGAFSSTPGTTGGLGPGPYFNPLELQFKHNGGRLTSIDATVNAATLGGTVLIQVVQGQIDGPESAAQGKIVFQDRFPMTDLSSPVSGPPGLELLSTWSGTLSPSDWTGGCGSGPYEITVQVTPEVNPTTPTYPHSGEAILSGSFSCSSWVPFT
jgi:hypothetical protein